MSESCTAEQRAEQLEREIWKLIDDGKLRLQNGSYLRGWPECSKSAAAGAWS